MRQESDLESQMYDQIHEVINDILPDDIDPSPHRCASCGSQVFHEDTDAEDLNLPIHLPPETAHLMENSPTEELPETIESLQLQFCDNHWAAIKEWIGQPGLVSYSSFDLQFVAPQTKTRPRSSSKWDHERLRIARDRIQTDADSPPERYESTITEKLQATLLIAAVDQYGINYSPTQQAIPHLVDELTKHGYDASPLRSPFVDIRIEDETFDHSVIGTVFTIDSTDEANSNGPLPKWKVGPERIVSDTTYIWLSGNTFHESTYDQYSDSIYVGFYWIADRGEWVWYPFEPGFESGPRTTDRTYLPILGPMNSSPALGLDALSAATLNTEAYEEKVRENWDTIESSRPFSDRVRDWLYRTLK